MVVFVIDSGYMKKFSDDSSLKKIFKALFDVVVKRNLPRCVVVTKIDSFVLKNGDEKVNLFTKDPVDPDFGFRLCTNSVAFKEMKTKIYQMFEGDIVNIYLIINYIPNEKKPSMLVYIIFNFRTENQKYEFGKNSQRLATIKNEVKIFGF